MSTLKKIGCYSIAYIAMVAMVLLASAVAYEYDRKLFELIVVNGLVAASIAYFIAAIASAQSSKLSLACLPFRTYPSRSFEIVASSSVTRLDIGTK